MEQATFGGGCFWCVEAVLQRVDGVEKVVSGYAGGTTKMPTYEQVCTGRTGHAEVVQVTYDPSKVTFERLMEIFMKTHDPTTLNRQGHDEGTQYRSIILTHNDEQARLAKEIKEKLDAAKVFDGPIVTFIQPLTEFYPAEEDHQNYFNRNPSSRYCQVVVRSKVEKLEKFFKAYMKTP
ncbi:MAG: peptide-methionine (S)-S-oxide reductase MsrA [Pirellulaceae bacterium]|nr:peptide-methionine (S)-S-oxide reductase MsrA [Pirellulaceae bacterium]